MSYTNPYVKKLGAMAKDAKKAAQAEASALTDMMSDPGYLRQSSALIHEALQKGFDVLQLANGDIMTTGTKTVVYQYRWDAEKGKLAKVKVSEKKARRAQPSMIDDDEDALA